MKPKHYITVVLLTIIIIGGCASGLKYEEFASTLQPVSPDYGRIYIYRTTVFGAAVQPSVRLNGEVIGKATPKGFFYVDRPAGTYEISASTEAKRSLSLNLEAGEEKYVRLEIKMGAFVGHVKPVLVDNVVGQQEIKKTKYIVKK
jgi:hypothetical protein